MKRVLGFCLFLLLAAAPAMATPKNYYAPPGQFNAAFQVMDGGLSSVMGFLGEATGRFSYDPEAEEIGDVKLAISTAGLSTPSRDAGADLTALFDPQHHPEIIFMAKTPGSIKDGKGFVKGTLTIKGESKPATFEVSLNKGETRKVLGLSLKSSFKRADFAMGDPPEIPGRFGESISLTFEMQAIRQ